MTDKQWQQKLQEAEKHLAEVEPHFASFMAERGGCRLKLEKDGYALLCHSILCQQISMVVAKTLAKRLIAFGGQESFHAEAIANASDEELRALGLSRQKIRYLRIVSQKHFTEPKFFAHLRKKDNEEIFQALLPLPGIGPWTIEMYLIFSLGRLDVLPLGDLGIVNAMKRLMGTQDKPSKEALLARAEPWRPYRSIASWFLWSHTDPVDWP